MAEHPILMTGWSMNAIREGRKTMTRRVVKPQPVPDLEGFFPRCPYGVLGDVLWVREKLKRVWGPRGLYVPEYEDFERPPGDHLWHWKGEVLPAIFMPRWACRERLLLEAVRVERVQDASDEDIVAEGIDIGKEPYPADMPECRDFDVDFAVAFSEVWDGINAKRGYGWDSNPWVWVLTFRRRERPRERTDGDR